VRAELERYCSVSSSDDAIGEDAKKETKGDQNVGGPRLWLFDSTMSTSCEHCPRIILQKNPSKKASTSTASVRAPPSISSSTRIPSIPRPSKQNKSPLGAAQLPVVQRQKQRHASKSVCSMARTLRTIVCHTRGAGHGQTLFVCPDCVLNRPAGREPLAPQNEDKDKTKDTNNLMINQTSLLTATTEAWIAPLVAGPNSKLTVTLIVTTTSLKTSMPSLVDQAATDDGKYAPMTRQQHHVIDMTPAAHRAPSDVKLMELTKEAFDWKDAHVLEYADSLPPRPLQCRRENEPIRKFTTVDRIRQTTPHSWQ